MMINDPANRKSFITIPAEQFQWSILSVNEDSRETFWLVNKPQAKVLNQHLTVQQSANVEPRLRTNCNASHN
jgi:hypothetical protein